MDAGERIRFLEAIADVARCIHEAQMALQRARSQCHGETYEHIDLMCTRAYELQVRAEWIRHVALGNASLTLEAVDPQVRQGPDRRRGVDRRIAGMRKALLENA